MNEYQESTFNRTLFLNSDKKVKKHKCHYCGKEYFVFPDTPYSCPAHLSVGYEKVDPFSGIKYFEKENEDKLKQIDEYSNKYVGKIFSSKYGNVFVLDILTLDYFLFITTPDYQLHIAPIQFLFDVDKETKEYR